MISGPGLVPCLLTACWLECLFFSTTSRSLVVLYAPRCTQASTGQMYRHSDRPRAGACSHAHRGANRASMSDSVRGPLCGLQDDSENHRMHSTPSERGSQKKTGNRGVRTFEEAWVIVSGDADARRGLPGLACQPSVCHALHVGGVRQRFGCSLLSRNEDTNDDPGVLSSLICSNRFGDFFLLCF